MEVRSDEISAGCGVADANSLAAEIRRRIGPPPQLLAWPMVSVVVLNRDGAPHLRRLLSGLLGKTDYPELELIVVDNASSDDSLEFLRGAEAPFPISIVANAHNESFSDACNQGAELASGELLLFLNNDAEPFEPGWLRELVACLRESGAGAVGPTLIEPGEPSAGSNGYVVHQRGLWLEDRRGLLAPRHRDRLADPLGEWLGEDSEPIVVVGACLLIERGNFDRVSGFTRGYWYGPEDVDLALKLRDEGFASVCSGRSLLIHPPSSTLETIEAQQLGAWVRGNRRLFMERWGPRVRRELELDRLGGGGRWVPPDQAASDPPRFGRSELDRLGFCLLAATPVSDAELALADPLEDLRAALRDRGYRCIALRGPKVDDLAGLDYDVAVCLGGSRRYAPKPGQLNVLWVVDRFNALSPVECSRYDLIVSEREDLLQRLHAEGIAVEKTSVLDGDRPESIATGLLAAVEARADEIGYRTRIGFDPARVPA